MNLLDFLIPTANAQAAAAPAPAGGFGLTMLLPFALIAVMYFMMIRPQMKRAKEQKAMLGDLKKGDEVLTTSGIAGTVVELGENFIVVDVSVDGNGTRMRFQKAAVGNVLPKGTLKSTN